MHLAWSFVGAERKANMMEQLLDETRILAQSGFARASAARSLAMPFIVKVKEQ